MTNRTRARRRLLRLSRYHERCAALSAISSNQWMNRLLAFTPARSLIRYRARPNGDFYTWREHP